MNFILKPWQLFFLILAGWVNGATSPGLLGEMEATMGLRSQRSFSLPAPTAHGQRKFNSDPKDKVGTKFAT